jgi:hypothetical protein
LQIKKSKIKINELTNNKRAEMHKMGRVEYSLEKNMYMTKISFIRDKTTKQIIPYKNFDTRFHEEISHAGVILNFPNLPFLAFAMATSSAEVRIGNTVMPCIRGSGIIKYINNLLFVKHVEFGMHFRVMKNESEFVEEFSSKLNVDKNALALSLTQSTIYSYLNHRPYILTTQTFLNPKKEISLKPGDHKFISSPDGIIPSQTATVLELSYDSKIEDKELILEKMSGIEGEFSEYASSGEAAEKLVCVHFEISKNNE